MEEREPDMPYIQMDVDNVRDTFFRDRRVTFGHTPPSSPPPVSTGPLVTNTFKKERDWKYSVGFSDLPQGQTEDTTVYDESYFSDVEDATSPPPPPTSRASSLSRSPSPSSASIISTPSPVPTESTPSPVPVSPQPGPSNSRRLPRQRTRSTSRSPSSSPDTSIFRLLRDPHPGDLVDEEATSDTDSDLDVPIPQYFSPDPETVSQIIHNYSH